MLPDMFRLLSAEFWGPFTAWLSVSVLMPLVTAYFFNFKLKAATKRNVQAQVDPLVFNLMKTFFAWLAFNQGFDFFVLGKDSLARVNASLLGNHQGLMVGTGICTLLRLYEAVLKI